MARAHEKSANEVEDYLNQTSPQKSAKQLRDELDFGDDQDTRSICGRADILNCCPTKQQINDATFCNRMVMASVAVVMLWMSSLSVALSLVQYAIPTPSSDAVYSVCSYAYDVSTNERSAYIACADRQLESCNDAFTESIDGTLATVLSNFEYNTALLESSRAAQATCAAASTNAQAALGVWQEGGTEQVIEYDVTTCTDSSDLSTCPVSCSMDIDQTVARNSTCTCADVAKRVNDIGSARTESYGLATGYSDYAGAVVGSLAAYSSARANYDKEYIKNHTHLARVRLYQALTAAAVPHVAGINVSFAPLVPKTENVIACASVSDSACDTAGIESVAERFAEVFAMLGAQLDDARETFADFAEDADEYMQSVANALSNMVDFYEGFKAWVEAVGIDTDGLPWFKIGIEDFIVSDPNLPSGVGITSDFAAIPGAEEMWATVEPFYERYLANITFASMHTHLLAKNWAKEIGAFTDAFPGFFPNDYNPPQYSDYGDEENVTAARKKHSDESNAFVARQASALNAFAEIESYDDDDGGTTFNGYNFSIGDDALNFVGGLYFPFEPLRGSSIKFNVWMVSMGDLTSLLVLFDYLYRAYQSLQIFARFYGRSGLLVPDVDMRVDRDEFEFAKSPVKATLEVLTSPLMLAAIAAFFLVLLVVNFCALYIPTLVAYKQGCVTGAANGTFVSNNLYSVSYNYAASDGNEDLFNGLSDYNVAKADYCSAYATSTAEQQQEDELYMASIRAGQQSSRDDVHLLSQCVDQGAMDELFQRACCSTSGGGAEGVYDACSSYGTDDLWSNSSLVCPLNEFDRPNNNPFDLVSAYLGTSACELPKASWSEWELRDAVFRCGDVPDCTTTCSGPNQALLRAVSEQCGCSAEWLFHASWLRVSIGACIYILMNVSRIMFVGALCKLFWRYLSPGIFTYIATCDHHGNVLAPRDTEKYDSFTGPTGSLKKELNRTLFEFVGTAWVTVVVSAGLNALWIYFLISAAEDLHYDPSAQH